MLAELSSVSPSFRVCSVRSLTNLLRLIEILTHDYKSISRERDNSDLKSSLSLKEIGLHFQHRTNFCVSTNPTAEV